MHTSSPHFPTLLLRPFSGNPSRRRLRSGRRPSTSISAVKRDAYDSDHHNGRQVDQNMVVLRKRIYDMKAVEAKHEPPANWMEWEKRYFSSYDSDIFEAIGFLQYLLMETRPSFAFGMLVLVILSVSISSGVVVLGFVDIVKCILSGN